MREINKVIIIEVKNSNHLEEIFSEEYNFSDQKNKNDIHYHQVEDVDFNDLDFNRDASQLVLQSLKLVQYINLSDSTKPKGDSKTIKISDFQKKEETSYE